METLMGRRVRGSKHEPLGRDLAEAEGLVLQNESELVHPGVAIWRAQNEIGQSADDGGRIIHPAGWLVATPAAIRVEGIHADDEAFRTVTLRQWSQRADHIAAISDQDSVATFQGGDQRSAVPPVVVNSKVAPKRCDKTAHTGPYP
jgi:hypothetical protein